MEYMRSHYEVLGVPEDASYAEIRASYLAAVLALHPDKLIQSTPEEAPASSASEDFLRLQQAWHSLKDSQSRASYDRLLASSRLVSDPYEEVIITEMFVEDGDDDESTFYTYPCRCGDVFAAPLSDLRLLGFETESAVSTTQHQHDQHQHYSRSLILPCGSCSLQIRLMF